MRQFERISYGLFYSQGSSSGGVLSRGCSTHEGVSGGGVSD